MSVDLAALLGLLLGGVGTVVAMRTAFAMLGRRVLNLESSGRKATRRLDFLTQWALRAADREQVTGAERDVLYRALTESLAPDPRPSSSDNGVTV